MAVVALLLPARSCAPRCSRGPNALGVSEGVIDLIVSHLEVVLSGLRLFTALFSWNCLGRTHTSLQV